MNQQQRQDETAYRMLQREADHIAAMIVTGEGAAIDLVIAIRNLKDQMAEDDPDRMALFELIYESRFRRLWDQFRCRQDGPLPEW